MPFNQHVTKNEEEFDKLWGEFYKKSGEYLVNKIDTTDPVEYFNAINLDVDLVSVLQVPGIYDPSIILKKYRDRIMSFSAVFSHTPGPTSTMLGLFVNLQHKKDVIYQLWVQPRSDINEKLFFMASHVSIFAINTGAEINTFIKDNKKNKIDCGDDGLCRAGFAF